MSSASFAGRSSGRSRALIRRVPVWLWRGLMSRLGPRETLRFNLDPITTVHYVHDVDYVGDAIAGHRLDVITPGTALDPLPVYVYFHGGGWTSGDKSALTKYCASQAAAGMVVVNANYRMATSFRMRHMLQDVDAVLAWVRDHVSEYGGDPLRVVLGGDSAGGQLSALYSAAVTHPDLAAHYGIEPALQSSSLRGLVQHCSAVDLSVMFERGFILGLGFIRMLVPLQPRRTSHEPPVSRRQSLAALRRAARWLSPIEWVGAGHPPVFVTTSERDYFYRASLNYVDRLRSVGGQVETLVYDRSRRNTEHTWQQDARFPESQEVYSRLAEFVHRVTIPAVAVSLEH
ncbi:MAG: esterase [Microbacteriaceae bacterium]|nr:esterase [Microbacteriaceae bacterium]